MLKMLSRTGHLALMDIIKVFQIELLVLLVEAEVFSEHLLELA